MKGSKQMFESAAKTILKKNKLIEALENEKAKDNPSDWKIRQLEGKLAMFNAKYYPNVVHSGKGTYRKSKGE